MDHLRNQLTYITIDRWTCSSCQQSFVCPLLTFATCNRTAQTSNPSVRRYPWNERMQNSSLDFRIVSHTPAYDASDLQTFHPNCVRLSSVVETLDSSVNWKNAQRMSTTWPFSISGLRFEAWTGFPRSCQEWKKKKGNRRIHCLHVDTQKHNAHAFIVCEPWLQDCIPGLFTPASVLPLPTPFSEDTL